VNRHLVIQVWPVEHGPRAFNLFGLDSDTTDTTHTTDPRDGRLSELITWFLPPGWNQHRRRQGRDRLLCLVLRRVWPILCGSICCSRCRHCQEMSGDVTRCEESALGLSGRKHWHQTRFLETQSVKDTAVVMWRLLEKMSCTQQSLLHGVASVALFVVSALIPIEIAEICPVRPGCSTPVAEPHGLVRFDRKYSTSWESWELLLSLIYKSYKCESTDAFQFRSSLEASWFLHIWCKSKDNIRHS
jgi:hypothetical protein